MAACLRLLPDGYLSVWRSRVAAVCAVSGSGPHRSEVLCPTDILAWFRNRGMVTERLVKCCREQAHERLPSAEALAVCFAANIHPEVVSSQAEPGVLTPRVARLLEGMEKDRVEAIIRAFLPAPVPRLIARQTARVLLWIVPEADRRQIGDRPALEAIFRRKKLIPPCLVKHFVPHQSTTGWDAGLLAVCFAASVFPERAFQMDQPVELPARVSAFLDTLEFLRGPEAQRDESALGTAHALLMRMGVVPAGCGSEEINTLLADLSDSAAVVLDWLGETCRVERLAGAALFLSTSPPGRLERLRPNWQAERGFLRVLRQQICVTPLALLRTVPEPTRRPDWTEVKAEVSKTLRGVPGEHLDSAIVLTQMAWNKVSDLKLAMPFDSICDFWDTQMSKLSSGFPYFGFMSRFTYWWKQCLLTHSFWRPGAELPDDDVLASELAPDPSTDGSGSIHFLRSLREGYRLMRTTFFRRADSRKPNEDASQDPASRNERVRLALDAIWYERLIRLDEEEEIPQMVKSIADRFPDLGLDMISNYSHRLPIRMQAYVLARSRRLSNSEILSTWKVTTTSTGKVVEEYPFKKETGFLPITSLVRGLNER